MQGFESVRAALREAGLGAQQKVQDALTKAQRVLPSLRAMVEAWRRLGTVAIDDLSLSPIETSSGPIVVRRYALLTEGRALILCTPERFAVSCTCQDQYINLHLAHTMGRRINQLQGRI